jgi:hypothetical protein
MSVGEARNRKVISLTFSGGYIMGITSDHSGPNRRDEVFSLEKSFLDVSGSLL